MTMTDKERAQAYLKLADKTTGDEWFVSQGNVVSRDSYKLIALRGLQKEDTKFIAASRSEGPYFAQKYLEQLDEIAKIAAMTDDLHREIERLRKIEKAVMAVVRADSTDDIEEQIGKLEQTMNGNFDFNPSEYAKGFLIAEVERLKSENQQFREAMAWYADITNYHIDNVTGRDMQLSEVVRDAGDYARQVLEGVKGE